MKTMTGFIAGVLTVIAMGVVLIAYETWRPRANADLYQRPAIGVNYLPADPNAVGTSGVGAGYVSYTPNGVVYAQPVTEARPMPVVYRTVQEPQRVVTRPVSYQTSRPQTRYVERAPRRDWKKTAMVIGGSSAAGAGLGAIFGGKKGAAIGAAIGGGAATLYEVKKR